MSDYCNCDKFYLEGDDPHMPGCPNSKEQAHAPAEPFEKLRDEALKDPEVAAAYHAAKAEEAAPAEPVTPSEGEDDKITTLLFGIVNNHERYVLDGRYVRWGAVEVEIRRIVAATRAEALEEAAQAYALIEAIANAKGFRRFDGAHLSGAEIIEMFDKFIDRAAAIRAAKGGTK